MAGFEECTDWVLESAIETAILYSFNNTFLWPDLGSFQGTFQYIGLIGKQYVDPSSFKITVPKLWIDIFCPALTELALDLHFNFSMFVCIFVYPVFFQGSYS